MESAIHNPQSAIVRVLLVEDNPGDARLIQEMLYEAGAGQFGLTRVERLNEALECLEREDFDALVLDLNLPNSRGLETFAKARTQAPEIPIVVMTGLADEMTGVRAVSTGAQDYLVKGQVEGNLLARTLRYAIERKRVAEELRAYQQNLEELVQERTVELAAANAQLRQEIADRKRAEEALQEAHDRLEERVRERTAELQRFVNLMAGREVRMAELKRVIRELRAQLKEAGLRPVADDPLRVGLEE